MNFASICAMLAARQLWNAGASTEEIAKQAGKSPATIRRWLKTTGVIFK